MAPRIRSSITALEALRKDNHANWSVSMKNYLLAHNLWDIIETTMEPPTPEDDIVKYEAWTEKNASALNAIGLSCGLDIFSQIKKIDSAKVVWDTLAKMYAQSNGSGTKEDKSPEAASDQIVELESLSNSSNISGTKKDKPPEAAADQIVEQESLSNSPGRGSYKNHDYVKYLPLINAVRSGDLHALKDFLALNPEGTSAKITFGDQTALHIAVLAGNVHVVEELVKRMSDENLAIQDVEGYTALATATSKGDFRMIQCMIDKNPKLVSIPVKSHGFIPVGISMNYDYKELSRYLYLRTPPMDLEPENGNNGASLISSAIGTLTLDIAVDLIGRCPRLAFALDTEKISPLMALAATSDAFPSGKQLVFWKRWVYSCIHIQPSRATDEIRVNIQNVQEKTVRTQARALLPHLAANLLLGFKQIREMKLVHVQSHELLSRMCKPIATLNPQERINGGLYVAIFRAIKEGNFEFIYEIVKANPDLLYIFEYPTKRTIFMLAVQHRQAKIFSLIYGLPHRKASLSGFDTTGNNILHMAGIFTASTPIQHIPGAALQMQRELQWFKEVESLVPPKLHNALNFDGLTPRQVFTQNHEGLRKKGEEWMKDTASSCTVVGALIVTIMFAVAFTVPGSNDQNTGLPIFRNQKLFILFMIFDSLSLFSSSTSVLMFLGILTSRYAEDDFLRSLPKKMIIGLFALFFSIATMMVTFSTALLLILRGKSSIILPIICLASLPITLFVLMQFPLLVDMAMSTYRPGIFNKKMKRWI